MDLDRRRLFHNSSPSICRFVPPKFKTSLFASAVPLLSLTDRTKSVPNHCAPETFQFKSSGMLNPKHLSNVERYRIARAQYFRFSESTRQKYREKDWWNDDPEWIMPENLPGVKMYKPKTTTITRPDEDEDDDDDDFDDIDDDDDDDDDGCVNNKPDIIIPSFPKRMPRNCPVRLSVKKTAKKRQRKPAILLPRNLPIRLPARLPRKKVNISKAKCLPVHRTMFSNRNAKNARNINKNANKKGIWKRSSRCSICGQKCEPTYYFRTFNNSRNNSRSNSRDNSRNNSCNNSRDNSRSNSMNRNNSNNYRSRSNSSNCYNRGNGNTGYRRSNVNNFQNSNDGNNGNNCNNVKNRDNRSNSKNRINNQNRNNSNDRVNNCKSRSNNANNRSNSKNRINNCNTCRNVNNANNARNASNANNAGNANTDRGGNYGRSKCVCRISNPLLVMYDRHRDRFY